MIGHYRMFQQRTREMTTWRLQRIERRARRRSYRLGNDRLVMWACVRAELRDRGEPVPDTDEPPRWWQR